MENLNKSARNFLFGMMCGKDMYAIYYKKLNKFLPFIKVVKDGCYVSVTQCFCFGEHKAN